MLRRFINVMSTIVGARHVPVSAVLILMEKVGSSGFLYKLATGKLVLNRNVPSGKLPSRKQWMFPMSSPAQSMLLVLRSSTSSRFSSPSCRYLGALTGFSEADNKSGGSVGHLAMTSGNLAFTGGRFFDPSNVKRSVALSRINGKC